MDETSSLIDGAVATIKAPFAIFQGAVDLFSPLRVLTSGVPVSDAGVDHHHLDRRRQRDMLVDQASGIDEERCVVFVPAVAVGAAGVPVNVGLASIDAPFKNGVYMFVVVFSSPILMSALPV